MPKGLPHLPYEVFSVLVTPEFVAALERHTGCAEEFERIGPTVVGGSLNDWGFGLPGLEDSL
jgi:hypothetical protein